jgi:signal transduction histidine kinase
LATKLKNKKAGYLFTWLMILGLSLLLLVITVYMPMMFGTFENSNGFKSTYYQFKYELAMTKLSHPSSSQVQKLPVSKDDIHEFRYRYGDLPKQLSNVRSQFSDVITKAEKAKDKKVASYYKKERNKKISAIEKNFKSDTHVAEQIREERVALMKKFQKTSLSNEQESFKQLAKVFNYHFVNKETGEVITNVPDVQGKGKQPEKRFEKSFKNFSPHDYVSSGDKRITRILTLWGAHYSGKIYINQDARMDQLNDYSNYRAYAQSKLFGFVLLILEIAVIGYALFLFWKHRVFSLVGFQKISQFYRRIPIELRLMVLALELFIFLTVLISVGSAQYPYPMFGSLGNLSYFTLYYLGILGAVTTILFQTQWLVEMLRDSEKRLECRKGSVVSQSREIINAFFIAPFTGLKVLFVVATIFFLGMSAPILSMGNSVVVVFIFLIFTALPLLWFTLKRATQFNRVFNQTSALAAGEEQPDLPVQGRGSLSRLSHSLNTLKHGVKSSRNAQLKSERLKTELITNVSHDLRTPLTSIITYNDLLRKSDVSDAERQDYLAIIDRKAKRLKRLIDDLFDASKMASGAIELHKTKVNLNELLTQALAEYDEAIQQSKLNFRIKTPDEGISVIVDGQKLWRVFDNMIGNILKYSMEGTRVYITLEMKNGEAMATFKNITKYELGDNVDELFERFKRGDASRHTEGSGLGLAIAKSIIDLHGGVFDLDLDGDLFKVIIRLPIA